MTTKNWRHPEQAEDEVFVGNFHEKTIHRCGHRTARRGVVSYDRSRNELGERWKGLFPVFVKHAEIEAHPNGSVLKARFQQEGTW